ncbi:MCR_0457 family protein [Acinetobacter tianfuensis]|uniref:DUF7944 domain-containing protein n=1 Tax=Acinetobacter tianfuensis TaxID=2419603 RepID=A0A3A8ESN8_9GAMM|nr:hypothetical protein [Acinetobacter tianfuensis]RKG31433.1 hypothetical protein D7V32_08185 [Acinetobacter tianfuensis]
MKNSIIKTLSALALAAFAFTAHAENIDLSASAQQVSKHELAAIYVFSEICPDLISNKEQASFDKGYAQLVKENMPSVKNPASALKTLAAEKNFAPILKEARNDAANAGKAKNQEICKEITAYAK